MRARSNKSEGLFTAGSARRGPARAVPERRTNRRYDLHFPLRYRISQKSSVVRFGSGVTTDMSAGGLSFRCRKELPVGSHIEMVIDWPARHDGIYPIGLLVTGFVVRSDGSRTAVRLASAKFRVESDLTPIAASA